MRIRNVHERLLPSEPHEVGALIDGLASADDRLWPHERWPAMRFDRPLGVGADGGHAFVRYRVDEYEPGRGVRFALHGPAGFEGWHGFEVEPAGDGHVRLVHRLEGRARGRFVATWVVAVRWLHDALIEDALDKAERAVTGEVRRPARWSPWVRLLRRRLRASADRPGLTARG